MKKLWRLRSSEMDELSPLASEMFPYGRLGLSAEHNLKRRPIYYAETKLKPMPFCPSRRGGGSSSGLLHAVTVSKKLIKSDKINA